MPDKYYDLVLAYLENVRLEATADYVRRGRQLSHVDVEELKQGWVAEFKRWVANLGSDNRVDPRPREDIESELQLRKIEPPWDLVQDELERMREASSAHMARLAEDPKKLEQKERMISEDVEAFRRNVDDAKRN
jgi:hypothetical protein